MSANSNKKTGNHFEEEFCELLEVKESYYKQAIANLEIAANSNTMDYPVGQMSIEDFLETA